MCYIMCLLPHFLVKHFFFLNATGGNEEPAVGLHKQVVFKGVAPRNMNAAKICQVTLSHSQLQTQEQSGFYASCCLASCKWFASGKTDRNPVGKTN